VRSTVKAILSGDASVVVSSVPSGLTTVMFACWFRNVYPAGACDPATMPCTMRIVEAAGEVTEVTSGSDAVASVPVLTVPPALTASATLLIATVIVTVAVFPTALK
jgi:hypothetical protein